MKNLDITIELENAESEYNAMVAVINRHRSALSTANAALAAWDAIKSEDFREAYKQAEVEASWYGDGAVSLTIHLTDTEQIKDVLKAVVPVIRGGGFQRTGEIEQDHALKRVTYNWRTLPPGYDETTLIHLHLHTATEGAHACKWVLVCDGESIE